MRVERKMIDLERIDFSRLEKDELLLDWLIVYSRLISDGNFEKHKDELKVLAFSGQLNALAFYLANEEFEKRDERLVKLAEDIEKKLPFGKHTPEEFEVVAFLHLPDKVDVLLPELKIHNVKQLIYGTELAYIKFDEIKNQYDHRRYYDFFEDKSYSKKEFVSRVYVYFDRWAWLERCLRNQTSDFSQPLKMAQLGYYGRYFKHRDVVDACSFLDIYKGSMGDLFEYKLAKELSNGQEYSAWEIGKFMKKDCKKNKDHISELTFVIGKQNAGTFLKLNSNCYSKSSKKIIKDTAEKKLSWE